MRISLVFVLVLSSVSVWAANKKCLMLIQLADGAPRFLEDYVDRLGPNVMEELVYSDKDVKSAAKASEEFMSKPRDKNEYREFMDHLEGLYEERMAFNSHRLDLLEQESLKLESLVKKGNKQVREEAKEKLKQIHWAQAEFLKHNTEFESILSKYKRLH